jgi:hypothetical protein
MAEPPRFYCGGEHASAEFSGLIQSKPGRKVAETLRLLNRNIRLVFDWLLMTENFRRTSPRATPSPQPRRPGPPHFGKGGTSEQICPAAA